MPHTCDPDVMQQIEISNLLQTKQKKTQSKAEKCVCCNGCVAQISLACMCKIFLDFFNLILI